MPMKRIGIFMDPEHMAKLKQVSQDSKRLYGVHLTVSELIRHAVEKYLAGPKKSLR